MAPKGSISQELIEDFIDCTVKFTLEGGGVAQGTLHGVRKEDHGLSFIYGVTGTSQFENVEEANVLKIEGESTDGFVQLYPLVEPEETGYDEEEPEDEEPDDEGDQDEEPDENAQGQPDVPEGEDAGEDAATEETAVAVDDGTTAQEAADARRTARFTAEAEVESAE